MKASIHFVFSGLIALAACESPTVSTDEPLRAVRVQEVRMGPIIEGRSHLAEVVPANAVRVLAQVPGTVEEVGPPSGTTLSQGALVARISAPDIAARVGRVRAERRRAEEERDYVCTQLETDRSLFEAGDLPTVLLHRSEKSCTSAQLATRAALAAEREASVAGTRSVEAAPFDGQVLDYLVDVGQTVMPGTPLALYGSQTRQLRLRVVASELSNIRVGTRVVTSAGAGLVEEVGAQAQGPARLYEVLVSLDNGDDLRLGETLTARVVVEERANTSSVPDSAIGHDDAGSYVLVEEDAHLRRVVVDVGPREAGWVAIAPPLPAGTRVVSSTLAGLDTVGRVLAVTP